MMLTWFARDDTPVLVGSRVLLRGPRPADYLAWKTLRKESRPFLKPFEPRWTEADLGHRVYQARLKRGKDEARQGTDYTFFIFLREGSHEKLVGGITLSNIRRRAAQFGNLGYWMGQDFAGQGYMTEALSLVLREAFVTHRLHRVEANIQPGNAPSIALARGAGFRLEGFSPRYLLIGGQWRDHERYAITADEHAAAKASEAA